MSVAWTPHELNQIGTARELHVASKRADGTLRAWVPIWVVRVGPHVFVRTWYRRDTGWFGHVITSHRARIRVPGLEADVTVEDVGENTDAIRGGINDEYRTKYGRWGTRRMVSAAAAAATLQLTPERGNERRLA